MRRDPRITGLVESGDTYDELRGVELVGTARLRRGLRRDPRHRSARRRQVPGRCGAERRGPPFIEAQARKRIGIVIDVERTVSWDHTKLAGAY